MGMNRLLAITNGRLVDPAANKVEAGVLLIKDDAVLASGKVDIPPEA